VIIFSDLTQWIVPSAVIVAGLITVAIQLNNKQKEKMKNVKSKK
jgi:hypothetical protein